MFRFMIFESIMTPASSINDLVRVNVAVDFEPALSGNLVIRIYGMFAMNAAAIT